MKVNEDTQKALVKNLIDCINIFSANALELAYKIKEAKSVEEIMENKQHLLIKWVQKLPISDRLCYFCIPTKAYCQDCLYGKFHKICNTDDSDWRRIWKAKSDLMGLLEDYYKGEHYDNRRKIIYCPACNKKFRRKLSQDGTYGYCSACMMFLGKGEV